MEILQFLFDKCYRLGRTFGFGFWEGLIIYGAILTIIILKVTEIIITKRKAKKK